MRTIRSLCTRDSLAWRIAWRTYEIKSNILYNARYRSPVVRAFRLAAHNLKPYGVIGGGTDCDGMRYAGMSLHWTRAAADAAVEWGYEGAEGPCGYEVVTGREAREWEAAYEDDTRDRYAESMNY
jgi:hypothetical protein